MPCYVGPKIEEFVSFQTGENDSGFLSGAPKALITKTLNDLLQIIPSRVIERLLVTKEVIRPEVLSGLNMAKEVGLELEKVEPPTNSVPGIMMPLGIRYFLFTKESKVGSNIKHTFKRLPFDHDNNYEKFSS